MTISLTPYAVTMLLIAAIGISGLVQFWRGLVGVEREYDMWDVAAVLVEIPLMIWGIVFLYRN